MEWYKVAFDRIYPILYRHRDKGESELVLDAFGDLVLGRDPVLDLACGGGRYMVGAGKRGMLTWGVDLSEYLLSDAARHAGLAVQATSVPGVALKATKARKRIKAALVTSRPVRPMPSTTAKGSPSHLSIWIP